MRLKFSRLHLIMVIIFFILSCSNRLSAQIELLSDTVSIEEVVVTGSRIEVARRNIPLTVSTVERSAIERSNESAVLPVLSKRIPGVFVTERGVTGFGLGEGSAGQISMRGIGGSSPNTQVLVLIDGHPQYQGLFGHPLPDAYVSSDVEKVEVIRGPASILYGSNAMGGVINIITREQHAEGFSGKARLSYGSFNTQKYMASGGFKDGRFSLFGSVNHDRTDGHRDTSTFNIINGYLKAGYEISNVIKVTGDVSIAEFDAQDPGSIYNPAFFGIDILRGKTSLAIKNQFEKVEGGLQLFYNFGEHTFTNGWNSRDRHLGLSFYQGLKLFEGNLLTLGFDYKSVSGIANNVPPTAANIWHRLNDYGGYAYMQQSLIEKLILSAGLRLESSSIFGIETIPQVGASYFINDLSTIKGSWSKGFRSPTLMELYLFAPNPELEPERVTNYELSFSKMNVERTFKFDVSVFAIDGTNAIEQVENEDAPPPFTRKNIGSFSNKGYEVELGLNASEYLTFSASYSYLHLDKPRLAAPEHQFFAEGTFTRNNLRLNLSVQQITGLYTLVASPTPFQEDYTMLDAMATYKLTNNFELFLSGKNLLDQDYSINFGYPMPGITVFTGINIFL